MRRLRSPTQRGQSVSASNSASIVAIAKPKARARARLPTADTAPGGADDSGDDDEHALGAVARHERASECQ